MHLNRIKVFLFIKIKNSWFKSQLTLDSNHKPKSHVIFWFCLVFFFISFHLFISETLIPLEPIFTKIILIHKSSTHSSSFIINHHLSSSHSSSKPICLHHHVFKPPTKSLWEKHMGKRQVSSSSQSPPIPKKPKSKVHASKEKFDVRMSKKESKPYSSNQATFVVCHKVKHIFHEYSMKLYSEKFLNKHIESEYYVNNTFEVELRAKFLKPFSNHKLLKFIGMNKSITLIMSKTSTAILSKLSMFITTLRNLAGNYMMIKLWCRWKILLMRLMHLVLGCYL